MNDPRDFLALCRFAVPGIILIGIGLSGLFVHRNRMRFARSFCVALVGCQLTLIGAAVFQRAEVPITLTGTILGTGVVAMLIARWPSAYRVVTKP
jgi:multisubunit Na+/H+ antiporter MnhC subunit